MQCHNMSCSISKQQLRVWSRPLWRLLPLIPRMAGGSSCSTTLIERIRLSQWIKYKAPLKKKHERPLFWGRFSSLWERCLDLQLSVSSPSFVLHWLNITFTVFEITLLQGYFLCSKKNWQKDNFWTLDLSGKIIKCKYCRKYCSLLNLPFTCQWKCMPKLAQI